MYDTYLAQIISKLMEHRLIFINTNQNAIACPMTLKQLQQYLHIVEVEYIFFYSTYTYEPIDSFLEFQPKLKSL